MSEGRADERAAVDVPEDAAAGVVAGQAGDAGQPGPVSATTDAEAGIPPPEGRAAERRPLIERLGMAAIALVLAALFGAMAAAAFGGGEPFLGVMAATGALMTLWVGGLTLIRG